MKENPFTLPKNPDGDKKITTFDLYPTDKTIKLFNGKVVPEDKKVQHSQHFNDFYEKSQHSLPSYKPKWGSNYPVIMSQFDSGAPSVMAEPYPQKHAVFLQDLKDHYLDPSIEK